jgi:hypothetical protein
MSRRTCNYVSKLFRVTTQISTRSWHSRVRSCIGFAYTSTNAREGALSGCVALVRAPNYAALLPHLVFCVLCLLISPMFRLGISTTPRAVGQPAHFRCTCSTQFPNLASLLSTVLVFFSCRMSWWHGSLRSSLGRRNQDY